MCAAAAIGMKMEREFIARYYHDDMPHRLLAVKKPLPES